MNSKPIFKQLTKEEINEKEIAKLKKDVDFSIKKNRDIQGEIERMWETVHHANTIIYNQKIQEEIKQHKKAERTDILETITAVIILALAIFGAVVLANAIFNSPTATWL